MERLCISGGKLSANARGKRINEAATVTMNAMELFAVFEEWHIGDGNYPPLEKGQLVNLSFEVGPEELTLADAGTMRGFHHLGQALYEFAGLVTRVYKKDKLSCGIVVVETDGFRFYINSDTAEGFNCGDIISGKGTLLLDHYIWVEFLSDYPDPPDLFYTLRIERIWRYRIPDRFIVRSEKVVGYPTRVNKEEYDSSDITSIDAIPLRGEGIVNYVIQFADKDIPSEPVARTFQN